VEEVKDISLIPKVQISNLVKQYFKGKTAYPPAVDGLNLLMYESQISALLGHNGAGKTTTVSILTGLFPPTSGDCIMYGNSIVHNKHEARQSLGICPQHNVLFGDLTVYEHLAFFMRIKGLHPDKAKILAHAEEIGLTDYLRTTASALSGGNKRKLSVAIALCGDPDVLILDEPTSAMDPHSRRAVWELLRAKKKGRVTLLTTHFMDEAELLSDRIAVMKDGKLQCCGSPMFLKTRFGLGYSITVVLEPPMSAADEEAGEEASEENSFSKQRQRLADFLNERIPHTKLVRTSGKEVTFRFPQGSESMFQSTFDDLEVQKESLCIGAYGIQNSSLEEVFLQLAEDESAVEEGDVDGLQEQPATDAVDDTFDCEYSHLSPLRQIGLLYGKRLTIQRRDKKGACFAIILPVLVIALVLVILMVEPPYVGNSLEMSPGIYRTSSAGEVDSATNIAIGGRASGATGDATFSEELGLLKDGISKRYKNTEFTSDSGASSSMDMSEYLLDTYNNRDHATRFGAYVMNDVINLTLIIDLASAASELNTDFVFDGVTNVTGSNNVDLIALSGLRDEDGMFRLNIDFASLGSMATNFVGISPNVTFNAVSRRFCVFYYVLCVGYAF
jgi:ATP-binding cassette subfamily A (ABC1) protein 3